jgi:hypothetical protein
MPPSPPSCASSCPHLEQRLREVGQPVAAIRIKVQPR